jgi:beta-mannosidase
VTTSTEHENENWTSLDLAGQWRVTKATDDALRTSVGLDTDDEEWPTIQVPSHWQSHPLFATENGPLLYRKDFELDVPNEGERRFIVVDGLFYQGDVWLDGAYLGDPEGYFIHHAYDITALASLDTEHVLAVGATCSPQRDKKAKRNITGVFQHWDCIDPDFNPGGIWRGVRIERSGPVRIDALRVLCRDANEARANVRLSARLDSNNELAVRIVTYVNNQVVEEIEKSLASGINTLDWDIDIDEPKLWWPWSMGQQNLTDIRVEVIHNGIVSHSVSRRTGLREVAVQDWVYSINGERIFLKGANLAPTRAMLGDANESELRRDIELAREAGLDLVRVHGHISRTELYDAADELGMLIWQDFPLQWGYARQIRREAVRQAEEAVNILGHHPSIMTWCAHNEPFTFNVTPGESFDFKKMAVPFLAGHQLPSWNKSVLDRWVKRSFEKADVTRPVIAHSGVLPHLPTLDGTDSHLYFGWYHGNERDLPSFAAKIPRLMRFVSEFGAQAIPESTEFIDTSEWPVLDWENLENKFGMQRGNFENHCPASAFDSFDDWRVATQVYQADVIRYHIETLRRLKYRPTGGFCMFALNDAMPMVSWSVLDHNRVPKLGYTALAEACRPVIVTADRLPQSMRPGDQVRIALHVVSDLHRELDDATVTATVESTGDPQVWQFEGAIASDNCTLVGHILITAPFAEGPVVLDLTLVSGDVVATNRYQTVVVAN